jgi:hypothetical protein
MSADFYLEDHGGRVWDGMDGPEAYSSRSARWWRVTPDWTLENLYAIASDTRGWMGRGCACVAR